MLTIFSCPKPFSGHIDIIQRNAIKSWRSLQPEPEIILMGDEKGVKEICLEFKINQIPEIEKNQYGTPILSSLFNKAQFAASHNLMCFVNSDIIFLAGFMQNIKKIADYFSTKKFLISGRRWLIGIDYLLDFDVKDSQLQLRQSIINNGRLDHFGAIDYFVFPKGIFLDIPPFALGRCGWDSWLLYKAKKSGLTLVDASGGIIAIHQNHDYSHSPYLRKGNLSFITGPEVKNNQKLCKGNSGFYTLLDADYILNSSGIKKISLKRMLRKYELCLRMYLLFILTKVFYPYSYPLILGIRSVKLFFIKIKAKKFYRYFMGILPIILR